MTSEFVSDLVQTAKPELWPNELWRVLGLLAIRRTELNIKPRIELTGRICPDYAAPLGENHEDFNKALLILERRLLDIKWKANRSSANWVRLKGDSGEALIQLLASYRPDLLKIESRSRTNFSSSDLDRLRTVVNQYGRLGLRTAAQIVLGDSHALDGIVLPDIPGLWVQSDAKIEGASLVRVAGKFSLHGSTGNWENQWKRPGHYLWDWNISASDDSTLEVGEFVFLIENPYVMWELMDRWHDRDATLVCVHGETLKSENMLLDKALRMLLEKIYSRFPGKRTLIWCDPDPAGLIIADNALKLVNKLGGQADFFMMGEDILGRIEAIVIAEKKLKPLEEIDLQLLSGRILNNTLTPLAEEILRRNSKGEQEALALVAKYPSD